MRLTSSLLEGRVDRTVIIRSHKRPLQFIITLESGLWPVILQFSLLLRVRERARGNRDNRESVVTAIFECPVH